MFSPSIYVYQLIGGVIVITLHEFIKAYMSTALGDPIPKQEDRLTLNPFSHFDVFGILAVLLFGFGWGVPVNTSSLYYKDRKKGTLLTYGVPVITLFIFGIFCYIVSLFLSPLTFSERSLYYIGSVSVSTALLNLLPVYPFDGNKLLSVLYPKFYLKNIARNEGGFRILFFVLLFFGIIPDILYSINTPIYFFLESILQ